MIFIFEKFEHTFDIKSIDKDRRIIRGTASLEEEDRDGEIIAMPAIADSLKGWLQNPVIRFKHEHPIGKGLEFIDGQPACFVTEKEFIVTAYISDKTQAAKEAWGLIEDGIIKSFSVGGKVLEKMAVKENGRELKKITKMELYEVSVVDIPSNRKSFFSVIAKSIKKQDDDFECPYCGEEFDSQEDLNDHKKDCPKKSAKQNVNKQSRDDVAQELFNKPYDELDDDQKEKVNAKLKPKEDAAAQDISKPGAGTHSDKWDRCVADVRARGGVDSPEAVCTASLGEESFRGLDRGKWSEKDSKNVTDLINKINAPKTEGENPLSREKNIEEQKCQNQFKQTNLEVSLKTSLLSKLQKR